MQGAGVVAAAAIVANLFESFLGAALQGKALWLTNDIVNAIQISLAASIALVMTAYLYICRLVYVQVRFGCEMLEVMTSFSIVKACWPEKMASNFAQPLCQSQTLVRQAEVIAVGSSPGGLAGEGPQLLLLLQSSERCI